MFFGPIVFLLLLSLKSSDFKLKRWAMLSRRFTIPVSLGDSSINDVKRPMCVGISVNLAHPEQSRLERSFWLTMEFGSDSRSGHFLRCRDWRLTKLSNKEGRSLIVVSVRLMWAKLCAGSVSRKVMSVKQPQKSSFLLK